MASDPVPANQVQSQRVRVGMLGLASVFLLVMLATAILSLGGGDKVAADNHVAAANASDTPREPLAELGVAPGNPPEAQRPDKTPTR
jgi:hypothetical protein